MTYNGPLPDLRDSLTAPFWAGTRQKQLLVQRCGNCQYHRWPPAPICPECLTAGGEWTEVHARGHLWSYAVYHRLLHASFVWPLPYTVAMVELDAGPMMVGRLIGQVDEPTIGRRVEAVYESATEDVTFVGWRFS
jgi:uncharacterized OB-fold protein